MASVRKIVSNLFYYFDFLIKMEIEIKNFMLFSYSFLLRKFVKFDRMYHHQRIRAQYAERVGFSVSQLKD